MLKLCISLEEISRLIWNKPKKKKKKSKFVSRFSILSTSISNDMLIFQKYNDELLMKVSKKNSIMNTNKEALQKNLHQALHL